MTFIALTPRGTGQLNSSVDQRWITGIRWRAFTVPAVKLNSLADRCAAEPDGGAQDMASDFGNAADLRFW